MTKQEGDRVVITVKRQEEAATITHVGRVGYTVRREDGTELFRHKFEVFDQFDDGRDP